MIEISSIRNSEYTGVNRCLPCTLANSVIALALSLTLGCLVFQVSTVEFAGFTFFFSNLIFGIFIWLRGYLVPGTPELSKHYMPSWILRWFDKQPTAVENDYNGKRDGFDIEDYLVSRKVLEPCKMDDEVCIRNDFRSIWNSKLIQVSDNVSSENILKTFGLPSDTQEVEHRRDSLVLVIDQGRQLNWPSETAMRVDIAGVRALRQYISDWKELSHMEQCLVVSSLRIFLETCPDGGNVEFRQDTAESCCSTHDVVSLVCAESGEKLLEQHLS